MPAKGDRRGTRGERTRRSVLDAARRRFADCGFEHTTLTDIAADAGVAGPTVAFHFGSKQGLLAAVIDDYYDELVSRIADRLKAPAAPADRLRAFARIWLGEHDGAFGLYSVFTSQGVWRTTPSESGEALRANNRRITRHFERLVDDLRVVGQLQSGVSTRLIRDAFFGTAEHVLRGRLPEGGALDSERVADEILDLVLGGTVAGPEDPGAMQSQIDAIERKLDVLLERVGRSSGGP